MRPHPIATVNPSSSSEKHGLEAPSDSYPKEHRGGYNPEDIIPHHSAPPCQSSLDCAATSSVTTTNDDFATGIAGYPDFSNQFQHVQLARPASHINSATQTGQQPQQGQNSLSVSTSVFFCLSVAWMVALSHGARID